MVIKAFSAEAHAGTGAGEAMKAHKVAHMKRNRLSNPFSTGFGTAMSGIYLVGIAYCAHGILVGRVSY